MKSPTGVLSRAYLQHETPFSFVYGKRPSGEFISGWERKMSVRRIDRRRSLVSTTWSDAGAGLVVRSEGVAYRDFPVVEWTLHLKNTGKVDTPILERIEAIDTTISPSGNPVLHYAVGSPNRADDYRPIRKRFVTGDVLRVATSGGRSCNEHMPFFNIEWTGGGVIMAIGWPGQWAADFSRERGGFVRVSAGQELTRFRLHPGEEVRTPLVALLFYRGDRIDGQNLWRRWMVAHNLPRPNGKLPQPMLAAANWFYSMPYGFSNAQSMKAMLDEYENRRIPINGSWIDAGWYECDAGVSKTGYSGWHFTGTWKPDRHRYPRGVREASEHAHRKGLRTVLWFEPERVMPGTWLRKNHPEWLVAAPAKSGGHVRDKDDTCLLDLGNPKALRWAVKTIGGLLESELIDIYREDFNMDPLAFWRANDAEDRQGITEIRHVEGHLAFWDALRRRKPGLLIDVCASGGRRNDLESLRRAVPLWRTDYMVFGTVSGETKYTRTDANQCITHGISFWIPYYGTGLTNVNHYRFFSHLSPSLMFDVDPRRDDIDASLWRRLAVQHKQAAPFFYGDYYPLTGYSLSPSAWMAWQFDLPGKGEGMIQVFRREKASEASRCFSLRGLRPEADYVVTESDSGRTRRLPGRVLMREGLRVKIADRPGARLLLYKHL